jgi:GNAT superfamily N-acetyltransferase
MHIRHPGPEHVDAALALAGLVLDERRAAALLRAHAERGQLLVAVQGSTVGGVIAYRTDWFQCSFVSLVVVAEALRRRGIARALFDAVADRSLSPRLFSSAEEANAAAIQMHRALGFVASGFIDNLPQGYRELLFYRRLRS